MQQEQRKPYKPARWKSLWGRVQTWFQGETKSKDYTAAAYALADAPALKRKDVKRIQTEVQFEGVHPEIVAFWKAMLQACKARNIPVIAYEMLRTEERQNELYEKGRSKVKGKNGSHVWGCAIDIVHATRYWQLSRKEWDIIGTIGKEVARKRNIKITWGGDWDSIYDPAHWQLKNWRIRKDEPKVGRPRIADEYD
jgi:hypothetical protein